MKHYLITLMAIFCLNSQAKDLSGLDLQSSIDAALTEASFEMDANSIFAWTAVVEKDEIVVSVLNTNDMKLTYGCHEHGPAIDCHEEDHDQGTEVFVKDEAVDFNYMKTAFSTAVSKFTKTLQRRGLDFSAVESVKVWTTDESGHGHGHGHDHSSDVWTKFHYELNGQEKEIYVQCHIEAGETDFACHYSTTGEDEIEFDADHDHDHGHNH
jgi:hypothetical protein